MRPERGRGRLDAPADVSAPLAAAYVAVGRIYAQGSLRAGGDVLAMNFLLDRDAAGWKRDLAALREQVGECATDAPVTPQGRCSRRTMAASRWAGPRTSW
jgi:hypothetical protein